MTHAKHLHWQVVSVVLAFLCKFKIEALGQDRGGHPEDVLRESLPKTNSFATAKWNKAELVALGACGGF